MERSAATSNYNLKHQRDILTSYQRGVPGHGLKAIAKAHQLPTATIQHDVGNKISERSVSDYLARTNPCFTAKVVQDQEPEELTGEGKTEVRRWLEQVRRIPLDKRIYEMKPRSMQMRLREKDVHGKENPYFERDRCMQKNTRCVCTQKAIVHGDLADKHADTKEIERVAREAVEQMDGGETLIWDRLGRSGRASHPTTL